LERPVRAAIDVAGDNDWYAFDVVAERTYVVELYHVDSSLSARSRSYNCFGPYRAYAGLGLAVYDANGDRVNANCAPDGSGNVHAIMGFTTRLDGRFTLRVFPHEGTVTGNYYLRILPRHGEPGAAWNAETFEPNNGLSNAYLLQPGLSNAVTSTIEARRPIYSTVYGDNDWYRIEAIAEHTYLVEIYNADSNLSSRSSRYNCFGRYRTYAGIGLAIYDANENRVDTRCTPNGRGTVHTNIQFTPSTSGVYYIRIFPHNSTVDGQYSLRILPRHDEPGASWDAETFEPNNSAANAYEIGVGRDNSLISTIEQRQAKFSTNFPDVDWYRFAGVAEQDYVVEIFNVESSMNKDGNACTGSGSRPAGLALLVYDPNFTDAFPKGSCSPAGNGNVHTTVQFRANDTGWFYIQVLPNGYNAHGTYGIRVLPRYDQPAASWDIALEPNNNWAHAYPLTIDQCVTSGIEMRSAAFMTNNADYDWFVFNVVEGEQYRLRLDNIASTFGAQGLHMDLWGAGRRIDWTRNNERAEIIVTADYTGPYSVLIYPHEGGFSGTYRFQAADIFSNDCDDNPPPPAIVNGNVSTSPLPGGGVTIIAPPSQTNVTITIQAVCEVGIAQNVTLLVGANSFAMTSITETRFQATVTLSRALRPNRGQLEIRATFSCGGQAQTIFVGPVRFFDPSGQITDAATGNPIDGAVVTLYRVPDAVPDKAGQPGACRTVETREGNTWTSLPPALITAGVVIDPLADALNGVQQIDPQANPQITGDDGRYAWDVVEGCWYVVVAAEGYQTIVSPLVGVPPEVTDLDLTLTRADQRIYLPLTIR
jgi:hypothetical protein